MVGHRTETKTQNVLKFYSSAKKSEWPKTWEGFVLKGKAKEHVDSATGNVIPVRSHTPCPALPWHDESVRVVCWVGWQLCNDNTIEKLKASGLFTLP